MLKYDLLLTSDSLIRTHLLSSSFSNLPRKFVIFSAVLPSIFPIRSADRDHSSFGFVPRTSGEHRIPQVSQYCRRCESDTPFAQRSSFNSLQRQTPERHKVRPLVPTCNLVCSAASHRLRAGQLTSRCSHLTLTFNSPLSAFDTLTATQSVYGGGSTMTETRYRTIRRRAFRVALY